MHRHVRHLRLACAREDHARHGRILLEDALRTASFGDEGRLVLVRQLKVGRIPVRASATEWSRRLETSYQRLRPIPVDVDSSGAARAEAVYFANAHEPWLRLAVRTIAGLLCREWFWRPALPGWTPGQTAAETLRLVFRTLAARGSLGLTLLLARRLPTLAPLLQALQSSDLSAVQAELATADRGFNAGTAPAPTSADLRNANRASAPSLDAATAAIAATWPPGDLRLRWLAPAHLARLTNAGFSTPIPSPVDPSAIDALIRSWSEENIPPATQWSTAESRHSARSETRRLTPYPSDTENLTPETAANDRAVTRLGGLLFTLPLLARAGLPAFIASLPPEQRVAYPWHVLHLIIRHALRGKAESSSPQLAKACATLDSVAPDPLITALADLPEPPAALGGWLIRANRHALRLTGLNLRAVVLRPALVSWSPTHADLFFRPGDADIRIRRAGLDVDPGWVPWLNRVIHYHYNRQD